MGKLISREDLNSLVEELRSEGKSIVTTNGAFDIIHPGHIKSLKFAKEQGDVLIVGLNSDSSIKRYKSEKRPVNDESSRATVLSALEMVDYVVIFEEKTPVRLLEIIRPDVHVKGDEYEKNIPEKKVVEENGGKVIFVPRTDDHSTTNIIKRILGEKDES